MTGRTLTLGLAVLTLTAGLAGCLGEDEPLGPASLTEAGSTIEIVGVDGTPARDARATVLGPTGQPLLATTADAQGRLDPVRLPATGDRLVVDAGANGTWQGSLDGLPAMIELDPPRPEIPGTDPAPVLDFEETIRLGTAHLAGKRSTCEAYNCGASEPIVEVASDNSVYVSGVCCVGEAPPIWVSRDNGETFRQLDGDVLRDAFGIEGDFSIDDAGNLYFTDISVASAYIAAWGPDGEHRHTVPVGPFAPIVDRPWTRAGAEDVVHFVYNTGMSTMYYKSTDGGLTWTPMRQFEGALGTPGQGPTREDLWVTAGGQLHASEDAGESWETVGEIPTPTDDGHHFMAYQVPVVDEAGNVWIVYDWRNGTDPEDVVNAYAVRYGTDGDWHGPYQIGPDEGTHHLPWAAAGREGTLVVAWYGTPDDEAGPNTVADDARWYLYTAASVDATSEDPSFQTTRPDPRPVHHGPMDRKLLDFLQVEIGPDGRVHVAYAQDRAGQPDEATEYVRSTTGLDLAPGTYLNGP